MKLYQIIKIIGSISIIYINWYKKDENLRVKENNYCKRFML